MDLASLLPSIVTYWAPDNRSEFGQPTYAAPVALAGRWENKAALFRDAQGREFTSVSVIYMLATPTLQGYVALGDYTSTVDPTGVNGAGEIRALDRSPSLDASIMLYKAVL